MIKHVIITHGTRIILRREIPADAMGRTCFSAVDWDLISSSAGWPRGQAVPCPSATGHRRGQPLALGDETITPFPAAIRRDIALISREGQARPTSRLLGSPC